MLDLSARLLDLRRQISGQSGDRLFDTAQPRAIFPHRSKTKQGQQPIGLQLDNTLDRPSHAVWRDAIIEHGNPRKTVIINIKREMDL